MDFESVNIDFSCLAEPIVIAEIGVNHNCDINLAKKLVDTAIECGADVVKFQAFIAEEEISMHAPKAAYQIETTGEGESQLEMAKKLELTQDQLREIKKYCWDHQVPFLCSAFEDLSFDFLLNDLKVKCVKVASSEVTNTPFLRRIARSGIGIILSTGASDLDEVARAVQVIQSEGCKELVLLHCVSNYPAESAQLNLKAIETMRKRFDLPVGYSDHSEGWMAPAIATCFGAVAIEKHFTLDRSMEGPDHRASIEPDEMKLLVEGVSTAYKMMGSGVKACAPCEIENKPLIRKSIVAARALTRDHRVELSDLKFKRPVNGIEPFDLNKVLGKYVCIDMDADQPFQVSYIEAR